jgi:enamine deaminase RidA (YjgF/YER057c/UK114 family)
MTRSLISSGSSFEESIGYRSMTISPLIEEQARQCFENILAALRQAQASLADVVRVGYVVPNRADFQRCWPVLREYLGTVRPAATMISAALLDPRMLIEIEVTALRRTPLRARTGAA